MLEKSDFYSKYSLMAIPSLANVSLRFVWSFRLFPLTFGTLQQLLFQVQRSWLKETGTNSDTIKC